MYTAGNSLIVKSILSNPSLYPYRSSLATLLVIGVVSFVLASSRRSIHSHLRHSCWQKLMLKEEGSSRQIMYISDFPKAPGCLCCCRILRRDLNSDLTPVSSKTSRTAVCPKKKNCFLRALILISLHFPQPQILSATFSSKVCAGSPNPSQSLDRDKNYYFKNALGLI